MYKSFDNFFLPVNDLDAARKYYQDQLSLAIKFDFSNVGMLAYKIGGEEPAIILKDISKFPEAKPTIWFVVDNVKEAYQQLKDKGVVFLSEPFEIRTGFSVEFEDPFGNRLGITDYSKVQPVHP